MEYLVPLLILALFGNAFGLEDAPVCPQRKRSNLQPYIVGGDPVSPREFPGFVSIRINNTHKCGGAILNPNWILTIAHCMVYDTNSYIVVAGSDQQSEGTEHKVTDIIIHYGYNMDDSWYNDIAVAKVSPQIVLGDKCDKVTLPSEGQETEEGKSGTIVGFGAVELGGKFSEELRKVTVTIFNHDKCASQYLDECNRTVHDTQMCAGGERKGFCLGDTGGPLFVNNEVVGIASWTNKCAEPGFPDVYTDVSKYISWIQESTSA